MTDEKLKYEILNNKLIETSTNLKLMGEDNKRLRSELNDMNLNSEIKIEELKSKVCSYWIAIWFELVFTFGLFKKGEKTWDVIQ